MRALVIGFVLGVLVMLGGAYYYFASGRAPAAVSDAPMPFEMRLAHLSLDAHIKRADIGQPPVPANEQTFIAGADVYKMNCQGCHGLPNQKSELATAIYPPPPQLFPGKGVSDDPVQETYWKVANGIRLTGMPSFKKTLSDTRIWQVSQLLAHSNDLPESVKTSLMPQAPAAPASKTKSK